MSEPGTYEAWVQRVAAALHEDCILEWKAILVVDPKRELTQHATDAHYGKAHNLVRRLGLAAARGYRLVPASPEPPAALDVERLELAEWEQVQLDAIRYRSQQAYIGVGPERLASIDVAWLLDRLDRALGK